MSDILVLYVAFCIVSLASQPLFGLHIVVAVGLTLFGRRVIVRRPRHRWLTMGFCATSLAIFHTL